MNSKIMNKRWVALFIVGLFVVSLAGLVSADYCSGAGDLNIISSADCVANGGKWITSTPPSSSVTGTPEQYGAVREWFKENGT